MIEVWVDASRFVGKKLATAYVTFNNGDLVEGRLWVQAISRDDVLVEPGELDFGKIQRGATPAKPVTVCVLGDELRITKAVSRSHCLDVKLLEPRLEGKRKTYEVTVTIRADAPAMKTRTYVELHTGNLAAPSILVPVQVEIEAPALEAHPRPGRDAIEPGGSAREMHGWSALRRLVAVRRSGNVAEAAARWLPGRRR